MRPDRLHAYAMSERRSMMLLNRMNLEELIEWYKGRTNPTRNGRSTYELTLVALKLLRKLDGGKACPSVRRKFPNAQGILATAHERFAKGYSRDFVMCAMREHAKAHGRESAIKILSDFGASTVRDLDPEYYGDVLDILDLPPQEPPKLTERQAQTLFLIQQSHCHLVNPRSNSSLIEKLIDLGALDNWRHMTELGNQALRVYYADHQGLGK